MSKKWGGDLGLNGNKVTWQLKNQNPVAAAQCKKSGNGLVG